MCAGVALTGCFFELDELVEPGLGGAGAVGSAGAGPGGSSGQAGSAAGGSGGVSTQPNDCARGFKRCGGDLCVPMTTENGCGLPSCEPCVEPPQASVSCNPDTFRCQVDRCEVGYADCDGNLSTYTGEVGGNGCEYSFGELRSPVEPLDVPFADIRLDDGAGRDDWQGIAAYPLEQTCENCEDDTLPEITAQNEAPPSSDLDAYFRVAWDKDFLYVLAEAFDGNLLDDGLSRAGPEGDGRCQNGALCEDAFSVFFDGRNNRDTVQFSGNDDIRVFLGLGGKAFRTSGAPVVASDVEFDKAIHAPSCYRLEAQFSWRYIVDTQGAQVIDKLFPPQSGQQYGFDISVNDWDPGISDGNAQRQSQLFYINPGNLYHRQASGYIAIELSGGPDSDAGP